MQQPEMRVIFQERRPDGEWEILGIETLNDWEAGQIVLVLAGVGPAVYAALPAEAQARINQNIWAGVPPTSAMD